MIFSESDTLANCGRRWRSWSHSEDVGICDNLSSSVHRKSVCLDQGILGFHNCEWVSPRVLRTRSYDLSDVINYKRELVLLYIPIRNEVVEVIDRNRFMEIFDAQEVWILAKRKQYEKNISLQQLVQELRDLKDHEEEDDDTRMMEDDELRRGAVVPTECDADILSIPSFGGLSVVRIRDGILPKQRFCEMMRKTNKVQRALLLKFIHRIHRPDSEPIQIFSHGPAGSGKTFTLRLMMEICNRYTTQRNSI